MNAPTLDHWKAIFERAPFVADLGIYPEAMPPGECHSALLLRPRHLQHTGHVHAGVITTMADHTAGAAAQNSLREGAGHVLTAELKLSLLRAARGDRLRCVARVLKPGRQLVFTEAEVYCIAGNEETLVAKLSATMAVVAPRT